MNNWLCKGLLGLAIITASYSLKNINDYFSLKSNFDNSELLYRTKLVEVSPVYVDRMTTYNYLSTVKKNYFDVIKSNPTASQDFSSGNSLFHDLAFLRDSLTLRLKTLDPLYKSELTNNVDLDVILSRRRFESYNISETGKTGFLFMVFTFGLLGLSRLAKSYSSQIKGNSNV